MKPFLQAENLSKRWGELMLFENISFTVFEGAKVALIAKNGTGKSSLLDLLAGKESPDEGIITLSNDVKMGYFEQIPDLNPNNTVIEEVFESDNEKIKTVKAFELAMAHNKQDEITAISAKMDELNAWAIEVEIKQILTELKINFLEQKVSELSGGQQKRLALAKVLINQPDLLILDEPTNHLDLEMIEWLEAYLEKTKSTLLMVTHDRYFLDRVCNEIIEMEDNQIYRYQGNYSYFLEKRDERIAMQQASISKAKNLMRTEIEWMRRMPKARSHKAKYRVDAFQDLKNKASQNIREDKVEMNVKSARLGKKIVELEHVSKSFPGVKLIEDFSYKFQRFEKVGIVGKNGTGKSTFLNLLTQTLTPDSGAIEIGQTIKFGYYRQEGIAFDPREKVIEAVQKIAEFIHFEDGTKMSATQMLTHFLFPPETQYNYIEKLSGGEQRRLYLCTVLMQNPNFLILDEPTNDLDIMTLNVLEDYLQSFAGCVVVVSHDRFFMDKIVDHLFVFEGEGAITDFPGNYTVYRNKVEEEEQQKAKAEAKKKAEAKAKSEAVAKPSQPQTKKKLSFKEKREFEQLENEIPELEEQIGELEDLLNSGTLKHDELYEKSLQLDDMKSQLDEKELRWLELSELG
ncbi:ATP-binding cassette, subfamily F, uup [Draconibacterium orientale]|uniref:ABC transporter n=1 Tax=Draconibacterium orientale TaxID=1168034 RepID=X5DZ01_9BACT|nr:ABC-F family ATP-binding cassette domain-containing protein [Draconibacterium orientale]AHW60460.1 ABC transporter [Draconibacterium orientale]SEU13518.1 ATP-binding cassette, subfamily F, uup [Draconibacterium orientale]